MLICRRPARWAGAIVVGCLAVMTAVMAQEAAAPRAWIDLEKEIKSQKIRIADMLAGRVGFVEQDFDNYYDLVLEKFVHPDGDAQIAITRETLKKNLETAGKAPSQVAHARLATLLLQRMPPLFQDAQQYRDEQHARLVRGNAMLVISELNSVEPQGNQPATPLPEALPLLISAFNDANYSDALRIFAQVGILRHAEYGIADPNRLTQVQDAMLTMLATAQPPAGWSEDSLLWSQLRASDILGALKLPGAGDDSAAVVQALSQVVQNASAPLLLRGAAAKSLGQINYQSAGAVNYSRLAQLLADLSVEVVRKADSPARLQENFLYVDTALLGLPKSGEEAAPATPDSIQAWAAATPHREYVDQLATQFDPLRKIVRAKEVDLKQAVDAANSLAGWLESNPPAAGEIVATN